jgi:D-amino-acid dehydrogenase
VQFLVECLPSRTRLNTIQCLNLALYSRDCLQGLRAETGIEYDQLERGILQFYTEPDEFQRGVEAAGLMRDFGCDRDVKTPDECVAIEPALAQCRDRLAGGIFTATDESGDAQRFTTALARMAAERGVAFKWDTEIQSLAPAGDRIGHVHVVRDGRFERLAADAYVMALGSYSPFLLAPIHVPERVSGQRLLGDDRHRRPSRGTDRVTDRLRVEDRADASGSTAARRRYGRADGLGHVTQPDALRGTLGWTMACGSARGLADVVARRKPEVDFRFLS